MSFLTISLHKRSTEVVIIGFKLNRLSAVAHVSGSMAHGKRRVTGDRKPLLEINGNPLNLLAVTLRDKSWFIN